MHISLCKPIRVHFKTSYNVFPLHCHSEPVPQLHCFNCWKPLSNFSSNFIHNWFRTISSCINLKKKRKTFLLSHRYLLLDTLIENSYIFLSAMVWWGWTSQTVLVYSHKRGSPMSWWFLCICFRIAHIIPDQISSVGSDLILVSAKNSSNAAGSWISLAHSGSKRMQLRSGIAHLYYRSDPCWLATFID